MEIQPVDSLYQYVRTRLAELDVSDDDREMLARLSQMWGDYIGNPITRYSLKVCLDGSGLCRR